MLTTVKLLKGLIFLAGLAGGYMYYHFIGCQNNMCAISSNPYISVAYGGLIGILLIFTIFPRKRSNE
jgi:hypothetical protein